MLRILKCDISVNFHSYCIFKLLAIFNLSSCLDAWPCLQVLLSSPRNILVVNLATELFIRFIDYSKQLDLILYFSLSISILLLNSTFIAWIILNNSVSFLCFLGLIQKLVPNFPELFHVFIWFFDSLISVDILIFF